MNKGKEEIRTEHCSKYVDEDGYTNIIYQSPDTKMVIRYKGDKMSYWCNSELIYSGKYSKNLTDQAERQFYSAGGKHFVCNFKKRINPAYPEIRRCLINRLFYLGGRNPEIKGGGQHNAEFLRPLAAQKRRQNDKKPCFIVKIVACYHLVKREIPEQLDKFGVGLI